jgi:hypothetical protein
MQKYEFNAVVEGDIIHIPEQYRNQHLSSVRVILLPDVNDFSQSTEKKKFTSMRLQTKGFKFNREEANER